MEFHFIAEAIKEYGVVLVAFASVIFLGMWGFHLSTKALAGNVQSSSELNGKFIELLTSDLAETRALRSSIDALSATQMEQTEVHRISGERDREERQAFVRVIEGNTMAINRIGEVVAGFSRSLEEFLVAQHGVTDNMQEQNNHIMHTLAQLQDAVRLLMDETKEARVENRENVDQLKRSIDDALVELKRATAALETVRDGLTEESKE